VKRPYAERYTTLSKERVNIVARHVYVCGYRRMDADLSEENVEVEVMI
jgi:hypothetical protein